MKLAIVTTHPIQYYAPLFQLLSKRGNIQIKVFYTWGKDAIKEKFDPGFGKKIEWDIPLLDGYEYTFVKNVSNKAGSSHFKGIINPTLTVEIEKWEADAILVFGWSYQSHLKAMRYFKGRIPVYFRGDSHLLDEQRGVRQVIRRVFLKWVYSYVDRALYVGTRNKEYYLKHGLRENQLTWMPHAIDNQRFYDGKNEYEEAAKKWRAELKIPDDAVNILFAGKLENKKQPHFLVETAKQLNDTQLHWTIAGNGHLEEELKGMTEEMNNIHFIPFQNQSRMPILYRLGDIFTLPSKGPGETWGLAVNEAMACGKPVIVSDKVGCAVDLVKNGKNGYIFNATEAEDFSQKINQLIESNQYKKGIEVSKRLIQEWSLERACQQLESILI